MSRNAELPIAVVDSGVGGISVLRELLRIMPNENYIYYGDSKNAPYGQKSKSEVLEITKNNLKYLKGLGIKALVIACNTATSAASQTLREENPELRCSNPHCITRTERGIRKVFVGQRCSYCDQTAKIVSKHGS